MKQPYILTIVIFLFSCTSFPEKVKENSKAFILVAKENSKPVNMENIESLLSAAQANHIEAKLKALDVDSIHTFYGADAKNSFGIDSIVVFETSDYKVIYDFAAINRESNFIKVKSGLKDFEMIDSKLYIGKH